MTWINAKTGYTFGQVYGHLDQVAEKLARFGTSGGMADRNNTFGHVRWKGACEKAGIKPIYGVRLHVVDDLQKIRENKDRRHRLNEMIFIAKDGKGLAEIYELVNISGKKFYFQNLLEYSDLHNLSDSVAMLSGPSPDWSLMPRKGVYQEVGPNIPAHVWKTSKAPKIASIDNFYLDAWDTPIYEPFASDRKRERRTTMMHIPTPREWLNTCPSAEAFRNLQALNDECNVELPFAPMVKYVGDDEITTWCHKGARDLGIDIKNPGVYRDRYHREMSLIKEKDYIDYFLVTADLIRFSKTKMAVGPGRGSAAGSLVCYLMGITTVDPIIYGLFFERFLDPGRFDAPDIDIDFQDDKRHLTMKYLSKKYGEENVAQLGTVGLLKPKSAINLFSKALKLPFDSADEIKESMPTGAAGDTRKNKIIEDFFTNTDIGKKFVKEFPRMIPVSKIEGHPSHTGVHAAAIIVCNSPISKYAGILSRDKARVAMIDKKDAEVVNLLKIDALGLRTMTILAHVCDQIGKPYDWLYDIPVDDPGAFQVFKDHRYSGIFQFEGSAVQGLANSMPIESLEDISALCAIGRPGPMGSGAAVKFCRVRRGDAPVTQLSDHPLVVEICEKTFGMIIYQETMLDLARRYGGFTWEECGKLRKGVSKSMGAEFFANFKEKFIHGAINNGDTEASASIVWEGIQTMGGYAFNKCLSGDTQVRLANGNSEIKSGCTIKDIYDLYVTNRDSRMRRNNGWPSLISYYPDKGRCFPQKIKMIHKNGPKRCNRYHFNDGSFVECTPDHKFIINGEWATVSTGVIGDRFLSGEYTGTGYKVNGKGQDHNRGIRYKNPQKGFGVGELNPSYVNGKTPAITIFRSKNLNNPCISCGRFHDRMEIHHSDMMGGVKDPTGLRWLCPSCHKKIHYKNGRNKRWSVGHQVQSKKLVSIEEIGIVETYDIEMPEEHNFELYSGLITHNSHSVCYGLISYLCAYMKAHHPLEFVVSNLNNAKGNMSARKILRDGVEKDDLQWCHFDRQRSQRLWSVQDGVIYGGLCSIDGMGPAKANKVIKARKDGTTLTPSLEGKCSSGITPFKYLWPGREVYGDMYETPQAHGLNGKLHYIKDCDGDGTYTFIGCLLFKQMKDENSPEKVSQRGGKYLTKDSQSINLRLEDDTGEMVVKIKRQDYLRFGKEISEKGKEEKDWYMIHGKKINGWGILFVENIKKITREWV